jgi:hypothetical protein
MSEEGKAEQPAEGPPGAPNARDASYKERKEGDVIANKEVTNRNGKTTTMQPHTSPRKSSPVDQTIYKIHI